MAASEAGQHDRDHGHSDSGVCLVDRSVPSVQQLWWGILAAVREGEGNIPQLLTCWSGLALLQCDFWQGRHRTERRDTGDLVQLPWCSGVSPHIYQKPVSGFGPWTQSRCLNELIRTWIGRDENTQLNFIGNLPNDFVATCNGCPGRKTQLLHRSLSCGGLWHNHFLHPQIFWGNADVNTVVKQELDPPIVTRFLRIYAADNASSHGLRLELYGCAAGQ